MRIYSWNVNGLRAALKKGMKEWMEECKPDILCVQETKLQEAQLNDAIRKIDEYHSYWSHAAKKGYSGVGLYTKEKLKSVKYGFGIDRFDREGRIIIAEYMDFTLLNIYFPNGKMSDERLKYKMDFYDATLDYCDRLKAEGKKLIICGDFNTAHKEIDLKNPKSNERYSGFLPIEREWIDKFISHGYIDTFRYFHPNEIKYSWWSYRFNAREKNIGWRVDYIFVSDNLINDIKYADILTDVYGSDHCPIVLHI
ncbi:exodeoxyribonuclease III [Aceticella autotrophica]|uniref:Exodeoxyribonuclease III n=1 Tax=Aceticella autotrophica TaxID=2755338 RepID=A0A975AVX0_9THEO|nr:exodeoxyribonuclease III [Aceticella autotrophica]QSZ27454.1 exodeoxyribonuclease III [Aceticella autotrophica]